MQDNSQKQASQIRELMLEVGYLRSQTDDNAGAISDINRTVTNVLQVQNNTPAAPSANLLYNGEIGHSTNSWFDSALTTDDKAKEAAYWFSHDGTLAALVLSEVDARTPGASKTLKKTDHTTYSNLYSRWNAANGWAEIQGTKTLDALLPSNFIDATTPLARVSLIASKRNQFIEITPDCLMFAGIYDNTAGQLKFLAGSLGFTANLVGGAASSTVERRYRIHVVSDRGFSIVSPEIIIPNAPADNFFSSTKNISMAWKPTAGQLRVDVYEFTPVAGVYKLLQEISGGFSYIHLGSFLRTVSAYPTSAASGRSALYYTKTGDVASLATNAVSPNWDTINFPIQVPDNYDKSVTTGRQWLRIGLTVAPNLLIPNAVADGSATITAPSPAFEAEYAALFAGKTVQILDASGAIIQTTTVTSRTDDTHILLAANVAAGTITIRIVAGGFHAVIVDKVHLGFQQNTSYAPNSSDNRTLQPVAAPTSSAQGGVGTGGSGGGVQDCVVGATPVKQQSGEWIRVDRCKIGNLWASAEFKPNILTKLRPSYRSVREVVAENGVFVKCTDTERFFTHPTDEQGTPLSNLRVGDDVITEIDGKIEQSRIKSISAYTGKEIVFTPSLSNNHLFIAGEIRRGFFGRITSRWFGNNKKGGFVLHNRKYNDYNDYIIY